MILFGTTRFILFAMQPAAIYIASSDPHFIQVQYYDMWVTIMIYITHHLHQLIKVTIILKQLSHGCMLCTAYLNLVPVPVVQPDRLNPALRGQTAMHTCTCLTEEHSNRH